MRAEIGGKKIAMITSRKSEPSRLAMVACLLCLIEEEEMQEAQVRKWLEGQVLAVHRQRAVRAFENDDRKYTLVIHAETSNIVHRCPIGRGE